MFQGSSHAPAVEPFVLGATGRLFVYLLFVTALLWSVLAGMSELGPAGMLGETGPIELTQVALLVGGILALARAARTHPAGETLVLFALFTSVALVRELDGPFDQLLFHGGWKLPAAALGSVLVDRGVRGRRDVLSGFARLLSSPAFGLLFAAAAIVFVESRILGMQAFWREALGDGFARELPRLVEELVELAGYALFLVGTVELWLEGRRRR